MRSLTIPWLGRSSSNWADERRRSRMADMVLDFRVRCSKPVLAAWPLMFDAARDRFRARSTHVLPEYSRGVKVVGRLADYAEAIRGPCDAYPGRNRCPPLRSSFRRL